ncbi:MAG: phosphoglycolate phosphatase [Leptospiraceae bacterium]|nr:MAG: phosphoglycolate phosphatase [Leptospiraceae bacterium]
MKNQEEIRNKLSKIKNIFFDVDGTLFSSEHMLEEVYHQSILEFFKNKNYKKKLPTLEEILQYVGLPVKEIFENLLPDLDESERQEISNNVLKILVQRIENGEGLHYDGVEEVIKYLYNKNYKIFAASNGRKPYVEAILKVNQIYDYFYDIPCIDNQTIFNKIELVQKTIEKHHLKPEECVIIGDRASDRIAAEKNHILFIAADYGHGEQSERNGAILHISSIKDLLKYF